MENPQKIGIGFLAYIVTSMVVSGLLVGVGTLLPSLRAWVGVIVILPIIAGVVYWYKNHVMDNYDNVREEHTPWWYKARLPIAIGLAVSLLPTLFISFFVDGTSRASVHFDNGTDAVVTLKYMDKGDKWSEISIPSGEEKEVAIVVSDTTKISLNGKERIIKVSSTSEKVFNIDTANTYIRTEITYGSSKSNKAEGDDKTEIIKDELFDVKADYTFKAPESISVKRMNGDKTKTVLYRMNDLIKEMTNQKEPIMEEK